MSNLKRAFNQAKPKRLLPESLTGEEKELLKRCIDSYIDSDRFDVLINPDQKIVDLILMARKLGLSNDYIDELKTKIF